MKVRLLFFLRLWIIATLKWVQHFALFPLYCTFFWRIKTLKSVNRFSVFYLYWMSRGGIVECHLNDQWHWALCSNEILFYYSKETCFKFSHMKIYASKFNTKEKRPVRSWELSFLIKINDTMIKRIWRIYCKWNARNNYQCVYFEAIPRSSID